jgi:hypothetical protein
MTSDIVISFGDVLETPTIFPDERGKVQVVITNQSNQAVTEPFDIKLYASTDSILDDDPLMSLSPELFNPCRAKMSSLAL